MHVKSRRSKNIREWCVYGAIHTTGPQNSQKLEA